MLGFIFGEGTDAASPEVLRRRRELIDRLGQQSISGTPQNLGQGINAIGQALFSRIGDSRLAPREDAARDEAAQAFAQIVAQLGGGGMPPMAAPQMAPQAAPVAAVGPQAVNPLPAPPPVEAAPLPPQIGAAVDRVQGLSSGPAGMPMGVDTLAGGAGNDDLSLPGGAGRFSRVVDQVEQAGFAPAPASSFDTANVNPQALGALAALEQAAGQTFRINSAFRDPARNARVGGANRSQHMNGNAFDIDVSDMSIPERQALIQQAREAGFSGIGVYNNSLHFDVGPQRHWGPDFRAGSTPEWALQALQTAPGQALPTMASAAPAMPSGGGGMMTGGGGVPAMMGGPEGDILGGGNMAVVMQLAELMSNPYMPEGQRIVAQALIGQQLQGLDPMRAMEMERARLELEQLRNPMQAVNMPSAVQEYEYYAAQEVAAGRQPLSYAEFSVMDEQAGVAPTGPLVGTTPQGFSLIEDPSDPSGFRMVRIPGGPEDTTSQDAQALENQATASDTVVQAAGYIREALEDQMVPSSLAGVASYLPGTASAEIYRQLEPLKAAAIVNNLQAMRDASPTGGALGAVTAPELQMLQSQAGALDPRSPNFLRDLDNYERTLLRVIHGREAGDRIFAETRSNPPPEAGAGGARTMTYNPATGALE